MYYFHRCGDRSPNGWRRHLRLRSVHVCTTLNLRAGPDKLWLQPLTTLQPTATTGKGSPPHLGTVQTVSWEALASEEAAWEEGTSGKTGKMWGFDQWETGKGRDPADDLLAFCLSGGLNQGREVLKYSLSDAIHVTKWPLLFCAKGMASLVTHHLALLPHLSRHKSFPPLLLLP